MSVADRAGNITSAARDEIVSRRFPADVLVTDEPFTLPHSVPQLRAQPGDGSITVSWEAPTDTGSGPLTGYTLEVSSEDGQRPFLVQVPTSTRTVTATGLRNAAPYSVFVVAQNRFGPGYGSPIENVVPGPGPVVRDVRAVPGTGSVTVSWRRPTPDRYGRVVAYEVLAYRHNGAHPEAPVRFTTSATKQRITGLTNDISYSFSVRAITASETGPLSARSAPVVPRATPDAPTRVRAQPGDGSALLLWRRPAFTGQGRITGYEITTWQVDAPRTTIRVPANPTWRRMTGLTNGVRYQFLVRAINAAGTGADSEYSNVVTPSPRPASSAQAASGSGH